LALYLLFRDDDKFNLLADSLKNIPIEVWFNIVIGESADEYVNGAIIKFEMFKAQALLP
jgi:hypothetical protein